MTAAADLGQPILLFILFFWGLIAVVAILTFLVKKGTISGTHFMDKWRSHHPPHHKI
jgi:hypothetical protein